LWDVRREKRKVASVCCLCYVGGELSRDGSRSQGERQPEKAYANDLDSNETPMALQHKGLEDDTSNVTSRGRLGHVLD
jgi:hypothetical protein